MTKCMAPYIGLYIKAGNDKVKVAPCCEINHSKSPWVDIDSDLWNNPWIQKIRNTYDNGQVPKECNWCIQRELSGGANMRKHYNEFFESTQVENITGPLHVDFQPNNLCNLKCRMCGPNNSNLIAKEISQNPGYSFLKIHSEEWQVNVADRFEKDIFDSIDFSQVRKIKYLGGEPFAQNYFKEFIDMLPNKDQLELHVTTNLTRLPDYFLDATDNFNLVSVNVSIDGSGDTYEYIRTNAKWDVVKNNFKKLLEHTEYSNTNVGTSFCVQLYNAFNIADFCKEYVDNFAHIDHNPINWTHVYQDFLNVYVLNKKHYTQFVEEIKSIPYHYILNLDSLLALVENNYSKNKHIETTKIYTTIQDRIRKTNIQNLDSRYKKYVG